MYRHCSHVTVDICLTQILGQCKVGELSYTWVICVLTFKCFSKDHKLFISYGKNIGLGADPSTRVWGRKPPPEVWNSLKPTVNSENQYPRRISWSTHAQDMRNGQHSLAKHLIMQLCCIYTFKIQPIGTEEYNQSLVVCVAPLWVHHNDHA